MYSVATVVVFYMYFTNAAAGNFLFLQQNFTHVSKTYDQD